jgi:hypothetical protein
LTQQWQGEWPGVGVKPKRVVKLKVIVDQQRLTGRDHRHS